MSNISKKRPLRRKKIPDFPIRIEKLSHEGRGLVRWGERILFVDGALPGEVVLVRITSKSSRIAEGFAKQILIPAVTRSIPECPHAELCGGCSLQHFPHIGQLAHKIKTLDELMTREGVSLEKVMRLPSLEGPTLGYRRRARLGVRWVHAKGRVLIGFRERGSNFIADIDGCIVLDQRIGQSLHVLENAVASLFAPNRVPQIEVAGGDDSLAIIVRHLDPLTVDDLDVFKKLGRKTGWHIYLQAKGPETVVRIWPEEGPELLTYRIGEFGLEYQFAVTDFTQINSTINRAMLIQAMKLLDFQGHEMVLDLFCGLGNFTLAAATRAQRVLGVEVSDKMVQRLMQNARHNDLNNVDAVSHDLTQPIENQSWASEDWDTLIIDPPRSGAKEVLDALVLKKIQRVLYVSCNPATLARDSRILSDRGFTLTHLGIMDMFPHTAHIESMALFSQRGFRGQDV